ncbi:hypothetical protein SNEBB_008615 [Seison nebaliae]|nr:hypothetical protein SNEBB_008615 [Seison nebaliae]
MATSTISGNILKTLQSIKGRNALIVTGCGILGYCIYFDYQRRSAPDFKKKLAERRRKERIERTYKTFDDIPSDDDRAAVQQYMMNTLEKGEILLREGRIEQSIMEFAKAIALSEKPLNFLNVLKTSFPAEIIRLIEEVLPKAKSRVRYVQQKKKQMGNAQLKALFSQCFRPPSIIQEDVE